MPENNRLLKGSVLKHLIRLTIPSIGGMFAITLFNITDTYFVSRLGGEELAAMGFTFPIVLIVGAISSGITMGAGSLLARALGNRDFHLVKRIATDGILLAILAVVFVSSAGLLSMDKLFTFMGAEPSVLELVKDYMRIWYIGVVFILMPPVSDASMRASGDMVRPFLVMMVCAVMNLILDPLLIFGLGPFPALGIKGASLSTVIARFFGTILTLSFTHFKYKMIDFKYESFSELLNSWKNIVIIGIPNVISGLLPQVIRTLLTRLASKKTGMEAVAALAAGSRVESFTLIISLSIGMALTPIIGQNYGAKLYDRVDSIRKLIPKVAIIYTVILLIIIYPLSNSISMIFSSDIYTIELTRFYIISMFAGIGGLNIYSWISVSLNSVGLPIHSLILNILGTLLILLPALLIGSFINDYKGMIIALSTAQWLVGIVAILFGNRLLIPDRHQQNVIN